MIWGDRTVQITCGYDGTRGQLKMSDIECMVKFRWLKNLKYVFADLLSYTTILTFFF